MNHSHHHDLHDCRPVLFSGGGPGGHCGQHIHALLGAHAMVVVKGFVLAVAAGVFLYMSTLHELKDTPLIVDCCHRRGFFVAVLGFLLTALVRLLIGEAHRLGG